MNRKIRQYIHKEVFDKLVDDAIIAARENATEGTTNVIDIELIQKQVELPRILIGEKLIADKPILEDLGYKKVSVFNTSDEFEVVSYTVEKANVFSNYEVSVYNTKVLYFDESSNKSLTRNIKILHEKDIVTFDKLLLQLKNSAIRAKGDMRGQAWKLYYLTETKFAAVNYNYAITAHKSQGSTYQNSVVIVADIDANYKIEERNRIKYVAFTRAKEHLFIVE